MRLLSQYTRLMLLSPGCSRDANAIISWSIKKVFPDCSGLVISLGIMIVCVTAVLVCVLLLCLCFYCVCACASTASLVLLPLRLCVCIQIPPHQLKKLYIINFLKYMLSNLNLSSYLISDPIIYPSINSINYYERC